MQPPVEVSVIIVNWNCTEVLLECLRSLREGGLEGVSYEIIVVDNASTDYNLKTLRAQAAGIKLLVNERNVGLGAASNRGMSEAQGSWLLLLNPDTVVPTGVVARMLALVRDQPEIGLAGCKLVGPNGEEPESVWHEYAGYRFPVPANSDSQTQEVILAGWVSGACMLVRKEVWAATGGFDPKIFLYGEDPEWCYRIWKMGWQVVHLPFISILHLGGESTGQLNSETLDEYFEWGAYYFRRKHLPSLLLFARQVWDTLYALRGITYYGALRKINLNPRWRQKYMRNRNRLRFLLSRDAWWPISGERKIAVGEDGRERGNRRSV